MPTISAVVRHSGRFLLRLGCFALTLALWLLVEESHSPPLVSALLIVGTVVLVFPVVWISRKRLEAQPTPEHVARLTLVVHYLLMILFGVAIIEAVQTAQNWRMWEIPIPAAVGLTLLRLSGFAALLTVVNLALRGLGAPFAIALSRRLATDWLYRWTRNPMVLATIACLLSFGLWIRSTGFVLWVLLLLTPAWLRFIKVYEERELELRFGQPYLDYKAKTPILLPGRPKR